MFLWQQILRTSVVENVEEGSGVAYVVVHKLRQQQRGLTGCCIEQFYAIL